MSDARRLVLADPLDPEGVAVLTADDVLAVEEGSLYPALYRMQKRGWVKSKWGRSDNNRKARFYTITAKGRRQLESASQSWAEFSEAVSKAMAT